MKLRDNFGEIKRSVDNILVRNETKGRYKKVKSFKKDFEEYFGSAQSEGVVHCYNEVKDRGYESIEIEDIAALFDIFINEMK